MPKNPKDLEKLFEDDPQCFSWDDGACTFRVTLNNGLIRCPKLCYHKTLEDIRQLEMRISKIFKNMVEFIKEVEEDK